MDRNRTTLSAQSHPRGTDDVPVLPDGVSYLAIRMRIFTIDGIQHDPIQLFVRG
jgi:hypothetical protein